MTIGQSLEAAADRMERTPFYQGQPTLGVTGEVNCAVTALLRVGGALALEVLASELPLPHPKAASTQVICAWNDSLERTKEDVTRKLREVAAKHTTQVDVPAEVLEEALV